MLGLSLHLDRLASDFYRASDITDVGAEEIRLGRYNM
jgi:hypothetical protein